MTIDATVGGTSANSYVTEAEIEDYFSGHPYGSTWEFDEQRLKYAAILLDNLVSWFNYKWNYTQAREFPRNTFYNDADYLALQFPAPIIPSEIKHAQCELDLYLLNNSSVFLVDNTLKNLEVGPIKVEFNAPSPNSQPMLPPLVEAMISKYGKMKHSGIGIGISTIVRA